MREAVCALMFCKSTERMLAVKRKDSDNLSFPGGKIEEGETAYEALLREIKEETGIDVPEKEFVGKMTLNDGHGYEVCTFVYVVSEELTFDHPHEEELEPQWITIENFRSRMSFGEYNDEIFKLLYVNI